MAFELREYSFGETLGKGFNLYFNNFLNLVIFSLILTIPEVIFYTYIFPMDPEAIKTAANPFKIFGVMWIGIVYSMFKYVILSGYIIKFISDKLIENRSKDSSALSEIIPILPKLMLLSLTVGFLAGLGMIAFVIPGLIISLALSIASNVLIIERTTVNDAIKRSWELTKGYRGNIFGFFILMFIINMIISYPAVMIAKSLEVAANMQYIIKIVISAVLAPIGSCILVVVYFNLKIKKEGFSLEHLAKQFLEAKEIK